MAVHSAINGTTAIPWRSSRKMLSLLEQLKGCQQAWCPGAPWDREGAHRAVCGTPTGGKEELRTSAITELCAACHSFLIVRDSATSQPSVLCVSAGESDAVLDYNIKTTGTVFQLSESRLSFSDLAQLVFFYSLTRDVLDVALSIPKWIYSVTDKNKGRLSQLEPKTWLCTPPNQQADEMTQKEPSTAMCSIQLTSSNGALCIINPLYLLEHGDDWLTRRATAAQGVAPSSACRRERRLSSSRTWAGAGIQCKRAISLDQEGCAASSESSGLTRARSEDSPHCPKASAEEATVPTGVVLRRPSKEDVGDPPHRLSTGSPTVMTHSNRGSLTSLGSEVQHGSPVPMSPHRVSWIEDGVWLAPPRPSSLLQPPSLELDSLSISSVEEEQEFQTLSSPSHHPSAPRLADKVINRLSAVGQALGGLVSPKQRLINRVQELSERKGGSFADTVKGFVETTLRKGFDPDGATGSEFLQEVRSSLTSLREALLDYPEIQTLLDSITDLNDVEIESLVELALHKVAVKPIAAHLYSCINISRNKDGTFERLQGKLIVLEKNKVEELGGSPGVGVPDSAALDRIQQRWTRMHEVYSPNKKVQFLLKVCKSIYESMSANSSSAGKVFGADDFLPCLTWVLLRSNLITLQIDTDYMMELLDPTQLQGEGGYYLTTLYASLYYISSFRPRLAARQLSVEAQNSINQWHRRRTLHCEQSRRSKSRRTIRRQACRDRGSQNSSTDAESRGESEKDDDDSVDVDESQRLEAGSSAGLHSLNEEKETEREVGDESLTPSSATGAQTQDVRNE